MAGLLFATVFCYTKIKCSDVQNLLGRVEEEFFMGTYKLDQHLKKLCDQNESYLNLYSTWVLNKRTCSDMLKNVVVHYPHFSMHDASHADAVISKMEMLLGERVENLSPTDTWLLLHAAYAHDLGMVVEWKKIEAKWLDQTFQDDLTFLEASQDEDLRKAIEFIRATHDLTKEHIWPIEASRYVRLINAALFRGKHAEMSKDYIASTAPELGLDLGHNHLIQSRLVKLLGQICRLHTEPLDQVMKLDYQTNGFDSDYAHPRFAAMMLRLGDLLDIDNGRFNAGALAVSGSLPAASEPHLEKHEATTHLLVTPREICFRSDCPNTAAYLEARNFVSWLEHEVDFLTKNWAKIAPGDLGGYAPRFDDKELLIRGVPDIEGVADLKFKISQDKAFQIIEGANIYEDSLVFLREVIQNAVDASKLQLWSDLCSNAYLAWMEPMDSEHLRTLQPYEIKNEIYKNYPIQVELSTVDTDRIRIRITDRGTGISVDGFKRMCSVGESSESSVHLHKVLREMPAWLRPTAGFGIGLQSIFLVTDQFTVDTSTGQEGFHAVAYSKRKGGYLQLQRTDKPMPRGTTICIETNKLDAYFNKHISLHSHVGFDPLSDQNQLIQIYIQEEIRAMYREAIFPLHLKCRETGVDEWKQPAVLPMIGTLGWELWKNRYLCKLEQKQGIFLLWDKEEFVLEVFYFNHTKNNYSGIWFKGIQLQNQLSIYANNIFAYMDIYGMETKKTITLDRSHFTPDGMAYISRLQMQYMKVCCDVILKQLVDQTFEPDRTFDLYGFWLSCDSEQKERIPETIIQKIQEHVIVLEKNNQGQYIKQFKPVRELIHNLKQMAYIHVENFIKLDEEDYDDYKIICRILNRTPEVKHACFVVDDKLTLALTNAGYAASLEIVDKDRCLAYYTLQPNPGPVKMSAAMQKTVLLSLGRNLDGLYYYSYTVISSKRYATFALEGYEKIAVTKAPHQIKMPANLPSAWIISPFVWQDEENRRKLGWTKEVFVQQVMASPMFPRVVDWVERFSILKKPPERSEIIETYQQLLYEYCEAAQEASQEA